MDQKLTERKGNPSQDQNTTSPVASITTYFTFQCPAETGQRRRGGAPNESDAQRNPVFRGCSGETCRQLQFVCLLFVGCLTSQQHASVSQGRICSDNFTCCHTEIEVADQKFYLTQSQYTDTGPTSPSADPITPGAWQGSHWSANF